MTHAGPELWAQTGGKITHLIAPLGSTGTCMGTSAYLKALVSLGGGGAVGKGMFYVLDGRSAGWASMLSLLRHPTES